MRLRISSGYLKGRYIQVPDTSLRPTEEKVRSAFFDILFSLINFESRSFLDVFAGSGAMSFESISRGLYKAFAVEKEKKAAEMIAKNKNSLEIAELNILKGDAYRKETYSGLNKVNVIYIDPPYAQRDNIPDLLNMFKDMEIFDDVCVIGVESDLETAWEHEGWSKKEKTYGNTVLTVFYNWE